MAIQGRVSIMGKSYAVIQAQYEFSQSVDETNKPNSRPKGGTITFVIPATSDDDQMFYRWMFSKTEVKSGRFEFTVWTHNNRRSIKTVTFENAYCIGLKDFFNDSDSKLMYTTVTIVAQAITVGQLTDFAVFVNDWLPNAGG